MHDHGWWCVKIGGLWHFIIAEINDNCFYLDSTIHVDHFLERLERHCHYTQEDHLDQDPERLW